MVMGWEEHGALLHVYGCMARSSGGAGCKLRGRGRGRCARHVFGHGRACPGHGAGPSPVSLACVRQHLQRLLLLAREPPGAAPAAAAAP
eukprot:41141-Chlamydomonas_euryale.AAC.1